MNARYHAVLIALLVAVAGCGDNVDVAPGAIDATPNVPDSAPAPDGPTVDGAPTDAPAADAAIVDAALADAAPADAALADAAPADAAPADAAPPDAEVPDAPFAACNGPLEPQPDGSTVADPEPAIVISEINPGDYIEVYNRSDTAVDLSMAPFADDVWCSFPRYPGLSPQIVIPALSYAVLDWDSILDTAADDAGGEMAIYINGSGFTDPTEINDYLCWGSHTGGRKSVAESAGKWTGDCLPAIPANGAINRLPDNIGTSATDYSVALPPNPQDCTP